MYWPLTASKCESPELVCRKATCVPSGAACSPNALNGDRMPVSPLNVHGPPVGLYVNVPAPSEGDSNPPWIARPSSVTAGKVVAAKPLLCCTSGADGRYVIVCAV